MVQVLQLLLQVLQAFPLRPVIRIIVEVPEVTTIALFPNVNCAFIVSNLSNLERCGEQPVLANDQVTHGGLSVTPELPSGVAGPPFGAAHWAVSQLFRTKPGAELLLRSPS